MVKKGKKLLSLLLTAAMVASLVVVPAFAAPDTIDTTNEPQNGQGTSVDGEEADSGATTDANPAASERPFQVGETNYATLAEAVEASTSGDTIYVTADVTVGECARFSGKNLTINGQGHTLTRGETFKTLSDTARSWYNPAMIEVNGSLRLENIVLDDAKLAQGTVYKQAASGGDNTTVVQDAIIATYDGTGTITLGTGAKLQNFGGMSAVRITGESASLIMESGSQIIGSKVFDSKGTSGNGAAGAVWMQGGTFTMNAGSEISGVSGRAVYADGGNVNIGGTISDIVGNSNMWQGTNGVAIHLRGNASATVGGAIKKVSSGIILFTEGCNFTLSETGEINDCHGNNTYGALLDANHGSGPNARTILNGKITGCSDENASAFIYYCNAIYGLQIGETAEISGNSCKNLIYDNSVPTVDKKPNNEEMEVKGSITNNTVTGCIFYGGNNGRPVTLYDTAKVNENTLTGTGSVLGFGTNRRVTMKAGSEICNNTIANGAVVAVNGEGNCFTMEGGTISGNTVTDGSVFRFTSGSWQQASTFAINGGAASDNTALYDLVIQSGGKVPSISSYLMVPESQYVRNSTVHFVEGNKDVTVNSGTKLGNANDKQDKYAWPDVYVEKDPRSVAELNEAAKTYGLKDAFATFWAQNTNGTPVSVKLDAPADGEAAKFDTSKSVYVLYQATDKEGAPNGDVAVMGTAVAEDGTISFNLPGNDTGYALALTQLDPDAQKGTLALTVDKTEALESDLPATLAYTATFTQSTENPDTASSEVAFSSSMGSSTATLSNNTATWTYELDNSNFKAGQNIDTVAVLTITIDGTEYKVLSNTVSTKMIGLQNYTVTFDSNGGSTVANQSVQHGQLATQPTAPTRDGYTFNGWTLNGSAYDFATPVTSDLTLVAQWTQNSGGGGTGGGGGGGGGGGIDIPDDPTPLGGDLQLNREDHFAYVSGYPDSSVQPGGHITREEVATIFYRLLTEQSKAIYGVTTNNFNDVEAERWSNEAISTLANAQVLQGYADGGFHPGDPITRAEFTAIVTRFDEVDSAPASPFSDTAGHWAEDVIAFAASKNWVGGYPDGSFRPQSDITRAEAMTMINNILDRLVDEEGILAEARQWPDNAKDAWYYYAVQEATNSHDYTRRSADGIVENWTALR